MRRLAATLVAAAACTHGAPAGSPTLTAPDEAPVRNADDSTPPPSLHEVALAIAFDADVPGRVNLTVSLHGPDPVELELPARPDQVEWFDPSLARLAIATPRVMWTVWNRRTGALVDAPHPPPRSAGATVTLREDDARSVVVDLGGALAREELRGDWCARAWLVGGALAVPSNIVCLRANTSSN